MKRLIFLIVIMMSLNTFAQSKFETSKDAENGSVVLKGMISFDDLAKEESFKWFKDNSAYTPDPKAIDYLKVYLPLYHVVVVMGTWCEDSQNLVPKLYTVLQVINYPMDHLSLYGVDRKKDALNGEKVKYGIEKVPTIIVFKGNREVGRIVENVNKSIETDLADILKTDK